MKDFGEFFAGLFIGAVAAGMMVGLTMNDNRNNLGRPGYSCYPNNTCMAGFRCVDVGVRESHICVVPQ